MASSGRLVDYLACGTSAARPASLTLASGSVGIYFATDTDTISFWTGAAWVSPSISGGVAWGAITGTLSSQTDLQTALNGKLGAGSTATTTINGVTFNGTANVTVPSYIPSYNAQTGTTYTFALADAGNEVSGNNAAAITFTIPPNSSVAFIVGTMIVVSQLGAGAITISAGAGVTLYAPNGAATTAQYDARVIEQVAANTWRVW